MKLLISTSAEYDDDIAEYTKQIHKLEEQVLTLRAWRKEQRDIRAKELGEAKNAVISKKENAEEMQHKKLLKAKAAKLGFNTEWDE